MEHPKCRFCGERHSLLEDHVYIEANRPAPRKAGVGDKPVVVAEKSTVLGTLKHCRTCRCFPKSAAERQKAYRERHKAKV